MKRNDYLYLDHAATTPMRESALEAFKNAEEFAYANSAGGHELSRRAKNLLEESRDFIASYFGAAPSEITFTSGGTEADNWVIKAPFINSKNSQNLVTSKIEHEAVLASAEWLETQGQEVNYASCNKDGQVDINEFLDKCNNDTAIASLMYANNETGVVQQIEKIAKEVKIKNSDILFHSDVVQAVSSEKLDFHKLGIDSAAVSGHKIGGPKGIGIMFLSSKYKLPNYFHGGKQELEKRAGTVNVSGVAGLAAALKEHQDNFDNEKKRILQEREIFENELKNALEIKIVGEKIDRLCHISNIQFKSVNSETLMVALDLKGLGVSRGSACASGAQKPSHVLVAMNVPDIDVNSHLRFSFGWNTKEGDGKYASEIVINTVKEIL
jgi:cysteine desulfurase|tara:strand:+ start:661 stop:1806 length:1146 start_codon:yes stop_codon:yes gene_type:complete